jgi:hypothetical protein
MSAKAMSTVMAGVTEVSDRQALGLTATEPMITGVVCDWMGCVRNSAKGKSL